MLAPDALLSALRTIPDFPSAGIQFKDITPILADRDLVREAIERLADPLQPLRVTAVLGIEARGFWFGPMLAEALSVGFVPVRKQGKLPAPVYRHTYALEYGTDEIEMHRDALRVTDRVVVHDDVIATGGTAQAAAHLAAQAGAEVVAFSFFAELTALGGRAQLDSLAPVYSVLSL